MYYFLHIHLLVCLFDRVSAQLLSCTRAKSQKPFYICSPSAGDRDNISVKKINHHSKKKKKEQLQNNN